MQVAALLGVQERADARMLLDEGLAACAEPVAGWGERVEVLALVSDLGATEPRPGVTPIAGASRTPWPFRPRSLQGVAMLGGSGSDHVLCLFLGMGEQVPGKLGVFRGSLAARMGAGYRPGLSNSIFYRNQALGRGADDVLIMVLD